MPVKITKPPLKTTQRIQDHTLDPRYGQSKAPQKPGISDAHSFWSPWFPCRHPEETQSQPKEHLRPLNTEKQIPRCLNTQVQHGFGFSWEQVYTMLCVVIALTTPHLFFVGGSPPSEAPQNLKLKFDGIPVAWVRDCCVSCLVGMR
jgi:hypothetical protein